MERQPSLFELAPRALAAAERRAEHVALAAELPSSIRFGGMSWSYRGWIGHVYGAAAPEKRLAAEGLTAYAQHPLLRAVEIDRSHYEPLSSEVYRQFREQVPDDFAFYVKAHEDCTVQRFADHARYGRRRGERNPLFLDASYAGEAVVAPMLEGLGDKLAHVLFQFPPQDASNPRLFASRLGAFLRGLPGGVRYAVELRNPELLTRSYTDALQESGAIHCHNLWTAMPSLLEQARAMPPVARRPLLVRWLLRRGVRYEEANASFSPFHRLVDEDLDTRAALAGLVAKAHRHGVPATILVDNKAEGCAPESIARLASAIVGELAL